MSLSSRFKVLTLRAKCEKFLMQDTSFPLPRKLMIADRTSTVLRVSMHRMFSLYWDF